ncbi:MAG: hypothetical protein LBC12_00275 [Nitrososphaerota archaeon]|nr:hypothetical protein [Nitrososphaerota archaeon]
MIAKGQIDFHFASSIPGKKQVLNNVEIQLPKQPFQLSCPQCGYTRLFRDEICHLTDSSHLQKRFFREG